MKNDSKQLNTANLAYWDELAVLHPRSSYYNLDKVIEGYDSTLEIEKKLIGDTNDLRLLHLQCHIGLDTISWARKSQWAVGVDYSKNAIAQAQNFANRASIANVSFIHSDIKDLTLDKIGGIQCDIAIASYGVLMWIENLDHWLDGVSKCLRPGGSLIIVEEHPFAAVFDSSSCLEKLKISAPYKVEDGPYLTHNLFSYAEKSTQLKNTTQQKWPHGLSEIFQAIKEKEFSLEVFQEHFKCHYPIFRDMEQAPDGYWHTKQLNKAIPLIFALKAVKLN